MNKQKQMKSILEDTIEHYGADPCGTRAAETGDCVYTDSKGRHCAVGRYLRQEFQTTGFYANSGVSIHSLAANLDTYLESNVLGLSEDFWQALQELHDSDANWNYDSGLSEHGENMYNSVKNCIDKGEYT